MSFQLQLFQQVYSSRYIHRDEWPCVETLCYARQSNVQVASKYMSDQEVRQDSICKYSFH